jgi:flagellar hook protein FlgE
MAISGNGFFVVKAADGTTSYTRTGDFQPNTAGQIATPDGQLVMGYPAVNGVVNTSGTLQPMQVGLGTSTPAVASTTIGITANLDSDTTTINGGTVTPTTTSSATQDTLTYAFNSNGTVDPGTNLMFSGGAPAYVPPTVTAGETLSTYATAVNAALSTAGLSGTISVTPSGSNLTVVGPTGITPTGALKQDSVGTAPTSTVAIYDSLGSAHTLTVSYTKTSANTWTYSVTVPGADVTAGGTGNTVVGSGTLNFNTSGVLSSITNVTPISIPTLVSGAAVPLKLSGPFGTTAAPTITQTASASTSTSETTDGYPSGTLQSYAVQTDGTIEGTYSNQKTLAIGQVAVASFGNVQGLADVGNNDYQPTIGSGLAVVGAANTGGRGTVIGGDVELSNVNIATEFAKLIVAQQAYSANAKSITTFNQVSQATLAMIQ